MSFQTLHVLAGFFWTHDPVLQSALGLIVATGVVSLACLHASLWFRLIDASRVERRLSRLCSENGGRSSNELTRRARGFDSAFDGSALAETWQEFKQLRAASRARGADERAPLRIAQLLDERPLLPTGIREGLLPALPLAFVVAGLLGAVATFVLAAGQPPAVSPEDQRSALIASWATGSSFVIWGVLFALTSLFAARLLDQQATRIVATIDALVASTYGIEASESSGPSEEEQREKDRLSATLTAVAEQLHRSLTQGVEQLDASTAAAAGLVGARQRDALGDVIEELDALLRGGVKTRDDSEGPGYSLDEAGELVERAALEMNTLVSQIEPAIATPNKRPTHPLLVPTDMGTAAPTELRPVPSPAREDVGPAREETLPDLEYAKQQATRRDDDDAAAIRRLSEALKHGMDAFSQAVNEECGASGAAATPSAHAAREATPSDAAAAAALIFDEQELSAQPEPRAPEAPALPAEGEEDSALPGPGRGYSGLLRRYRADSSPLTAPHADHAEHAAASPPPAAEAATPEPAASAPPVAASAAPADAAPPQAESLREKQRRERRDRFFGDG